MIYKLGQRFMWTSVNDGITKRVEEIIGVERDRVRLKIIQCLSDKDAKEYLHSTWHEYTPLSSNFTFLEGQDAPVRQD